MDEEMEENRSKHNFIPSLLIGISGSLFTFIVYYFGRQYLEGYYESLGIPPNFLHFDFTECIYACIVSSTIVLAITIGLFAYGILKLLIIAETGKNWSIWGNTNKEMEHGFQPISKFKYLNIYSNLIFIYFSVVYIFTFALVVIIKFGFPEDLLKNLVQLLYLLPCILYGFYITQDPHIISFFSNLKNRWRPTQRKEWKNRLRRGFSLLLLASLFIVLWAALPAPFAWGQSKGINDWTYSSTKTIGNQITPLQKITLVVLNTDKYQEIIWTLVSGNISKNEVPLILLLENDSGLFVRSEDKSRNDPITIIKNQDILNLSIIGNH